jgi:hypothetical protein
MPLKNLLSKLHPETLIIVCILSGPLWYGLGLITFRIIDFAQQIGLQPKDVLIRNTVFDQTVFLPFTLHIILFSILLFCSHRIGQLIIRPVHAVVQLYIWLLGIPLALISFTVGFFVTLIAVGTFISQVKVEFAVQEYSVAIVEYIYDLDYRSYDLYIVREDNFYYREVLLSTPFGCDAFQVIRDAGIIMVQGDCYEYIPARNIIEIDTINASIRTHEEVIGKEHFRSVSSLPFIKP